MGTYSYRIYLQVAPSLTSPTLVASRKDKTTSVYLLSDNKSPTDVLLGLALDSLTRKPTPFILLYWSPPDPDLPPDAAPTAVQSSRISLVHIVRSLKRCSLLCLPLLHHRHVSVSVHPHLSRRKGAIIAWPLRRWKNLAATPLGTRLRVGLIDGLEPVVGSTNDPARCLPSRVVSPRLNGVLRRPSLQVCEVSSPDRRSSEGEDSRLYCPLACLFISLHPSV